MSCFIEEIINKKNICKKNDIELEYQSFTPFDDFLLDLTDYFYDFINNKKTINEVMILNFKLYLDSYFRYVSKDNYTNICDKINLLYRRVVELKRSRPKNEQVNYDNFEKSLCVFLEVESYNSNKYDLEQVEIGSKLDYLIFEQNSDFIFELLKKSSSLCKFKYHDGQLLIDKVYSYFKKLVITNDCCESLDYFKRLLFAILSSDNYNKSNKLNNIIDDLKNFKNTLNTSVKSKCVRNLLDNIEIINVSSIKKSDKEKIAKHLINNYNIHINFSSNITKIDDLVSCRNFKNSEIMDFRDKNVITMDSKFKTAYDDALSFEKTSYGYLLGLYITDVASYVGVDGSLYNHAKQRGESIYISETNNSSYIPMFPVEITRNFFSLTKGDDRQVVAYMFRFSDNYDLIGYDFTNAIINVSENYSFGNIDKFNPNDKNYDMVNNLINLTNVLSKSFNDNYHIVKEKNSTYERNCKYSLSIGSKIVSTLTLFLNSYVASLFKNNNWPYIYRINETSVPIDKTFFSKLDDVLKYYHCSKYSFEPLGHAVNNMNVYGHITNPIRSFASYLNQYLFEYLFLDWVSIEDKNKFIDYWNNELPLIIDETNNRIEKNKEFVSVMQELNNKRLTYKK